MHLDKSKKLFFLLFATLIIIKLILLFIFPREITFYLSGLTKWNYYNTMAFNIDAQAFRDGNHPGTPIYIIGSLILKIGGLSENPKLVASEDYDCWLRLSKISDSFIHIPEILGFYEINKTNTSSANLSLISLVYINVLHVNPFILKYGIESPVWWQYHFARALYQTNKIEKALKILQKLTNRNLSWNMRIKVLFMLFTSKSKIMLTTLNR